MKRIQIILTMLLGCSFASVAQFSDQNSEIIDQYFENIKSSPITFSDQNVSFEVKSAVQLEQVGELNSVLINALQVGDNQSIMQKGNKNSFEYYCYYSIENINLTVNQTGNSNSLQIYGENSLMKNAIINQKSNFQELVIKNYSNSF